LALWPWLPTLPQASSKTIKIGAVKVAANGPNFIALEKGYFATEGLTAEITFFESAEPIAVAVVSGAIDFGATGPGGAFYNLAGQNAVRIVSGLAREAPGFPVFVFAVSNQATKAGFASFKDMGSRSVSVTQLGSPAHYAAALLETKYGIDSKSVRILPLQSQSNQISAVTGGQADSGVILATIATPAINRGDIQRLAYVGDETQFQTGILFTSGKAANERPEMVKGFLRAFRKGARDYHDAFVGADGKRRDGPAAGEILGIVAKYVGQAPEQMKLGISFIDSEATLDVKDIERQLAWFQAQGMVKPEVRANQVFDRRYIIPLNGR
jgi:NitT/TauT family transport system substrate-binding protein